MAFHEDDNKLELISDVNIEQEKNNIDVKKYDAILNSKDVKFDTKVQTLIEVWQNIANLNLKDFESFYILQIIDWAKLHALNIVLMGEWRQTKESNHDTLLEAIRKAQENLNSRNKSFGARCQKLLDVVKKPWEDPILNTLLNSKDAEIGPQEIEFFCVETAYLISVRLKKLCENHCEDLALNLTSNFLKCNKLSKVQNFTLSANETQVWYILDIHIALLYKFHDKATIIRQFEELRLKDGVELVKRFSNKRVQISKIWKHCHKIAIFGARFFLSKALMKYSDDTRQLLVNLMKVYIHLSNTDTLTEEFIGSVRSITNLADAAGLCALCEIIHHEAGEKLRHFAIEMYIRALTTDMNELERLKHQNEHEKVDPTTSRLASSFMSLSDLLEKHVNVARECVLTAFSLNPTKERLKKIEELAKNSGFEILDTGQEWTCKLHPPVLPTDDLAWECSECGGWMCKPALTAPLHMNFALNETLQPSVLGISQALCDDLVVCLSNPRYQVLSWLLEWNDLYRLCIMYLNDPEKTKNFVTELKFVDIDYSQFQHIKKEPLDEYSGIEKGYEQYLDLNFVSDEEYSDSEDSQDSQYSSTKTLEDLSSFLPEKTESDPNTLKSLRMFRPNLKRKKENDTETETELKKVKLPVSQISTDSNANNMFANKCTPLAPSSPQIYGKQVVSYPNQNVHKPNSYEFQYISTLNKNSLLKPSIKTYSASNVNKKITVAPLPTTTRGYEADLLRNFADTVNSNYNSHVIDSKKVTSSKSQHNTASVSRTVTDNRTSLQNTTTVRKQQQQKSQNSNTEIDLFDNFIKELTESRHISKSTQNTATSTESTESKNVEAATLLLLGGQLVARNPQQPIQVRCKEPSSLMVKSRSRSLENRYSNCKRTLTRSRTLERDIKSYSQESLPDLVSSQTPQWRELQVRLTPIPSNQLEQLLLQSKQTQTALLSQQRDFKKLQPLRGSWPHKQTGKKLVVMVERLVLKNKPLPKENPKAPSTKLALRMERELVIRLKRKAPSLVVQLERLLCSKQLRKRNIPPRIEPAHPLGQMNLKLCRPDFFRVRKLTISSQLATDLAAEKHLRSLPEISYLYQTEKQVCARLRLLTTKSKLLSSMASALQGSFPIQTPTIIHPAIATSQRQVTAQEHLPLHSSLCSVPVFPQPQATNIQFQQEIPTMELSMHNPTSVLRRQAQVIHPLYQNLEFKRKVSLLHQQVVDSTTLLPASKKALCQSIVSPLELGLLEEVKSLLQEIQMIQPCNIIPASHIQTQVKPILPTTIRTKPVIHQPNFQSTKYTQIMCRNVQNLEKCSQTSTLLQVLGKGRRLIINPGQIFSDTASRLNFSTTPFGSMEICLESLTIRTTIPPLNFVLGKPQAILAEQMLLCPRQISLVKEPRSIEQSMLSPNRTESGSRELQTLHQQQPLSHTQIIQCLLFPFQNLSMRRPVKVTLSKSSVENLLLEFIKNQLKATGTVSSSMNLVKKHVNPLNSQVRSGDSISMMTMEQEEIRPLDGDNYETENISQRNSSFIIYREQGLSDDSNLEVYAKDMVDSLSESANYSNLDQIDIESSISINLMKENVAFKLLESIQQLSGKDGEKVISYQNSDDDRSMPADLKCCNSRIKDQFIWKSKLAMVESKESNSTPKLSNQSDNELNDINNFENKQMKDLDSELVMSEDSGISSGNEISDLEDVRSKNIDLINPSEEHLETQGKSVLSQLIEYTKNDILPNKIENSTSILDNAIENSAVSSKTVKFTQELDLTDKTDVKSEGSDIEGLAPVIESDDLTENLFLEDSNIKHLWNDKAALDDLRKPDDNSEEASRLEPLRSESAQRNMAKEPVLKQLTNTDFLRWRARRKRKRIVRRLRCKTSVKTSLKMRNKSNKLLTRNELIEGSDMSSFQEKIPLLPTDVHCVTDSLSERILNPNFDLEIRKLIEINEKKLVSEMEEDLSEAEGHVETEIDFQQRAITENVEKVRMKTAINNLLDKVCQLEQDRSQKNLDKLKNTDTKIPFYLTSVGDSASNKFDLFTQKHNEWLTYLKPCNSSQKLEASAETRKRKCNFNISLSSDSEEEDLQRNFYDIDSPSNDHKRIPRQKCAVPKCKTPKQRTAKSREARKRYLANKYNSLSPLKKTKNRRHSKEPKLDNEWCRSGFKAKINDTDDQDTFSDVSNNTITGESEKSYVSFDLSDRIREVQEEIPTQPLINIDDYLKDRKKDEPPTAKEFLKYLTDRRIVKSVLRNVPGLYDLNFMTPSHIEHIVNVAQVSGTRAQSVTSQNSQTSTQVTPHIQRIGQPVTRVIEHKPPEVSTINRTSTSGATISTSSVMPPKPPSSQPSTLINILSQQIRPGQNIVRTVRPTAGSLINILSQQIIRPGPPGTSVPQVQKVVISSDSLPSTGLLQHAVIKTDTKEDVSTTSASINTTKPIIAIANSTSQVSTSTATSSQGGTILQFICKSSLPKFQQAFGKCVSYQKQTNSDTQTPVVTTQASSTVETSTTSTITSTVTTTLTPVAPLTIETKKIVPTKTVPINVQPLTGNVIYRGQVPVGQTISLIPPGSTTRQLFRITGTTNDQMTLVKETVIQNKMHALLAAALQAKPKQESNGPADEAAPTRITLCKTSAGGVLPNARIVKPVQVQIPVGSTVRAQGPQQNNATNVSSTTLEQLREFDMVYKQVKERSSTSSTTSEATNSPVETQEPSPQPNPQPQRISFAYVQNPVQKFTQLSPVVVVSSYNHLHAASSASPALTVISQGNSATITTQATTCTLPKIASKSSKSKSSKSSTTSSINHMIKAAATIPKAPPKPQEDEHTTQRIFDILAEYAEQLRNSPDLNNKPAPRRRSNPPTNPSSSSKRRKSSGSKKPGTNSSVETDTDDWTMGSEDSSNGNMVPLSATDDEQSQQAAPSSSSSEPQTPQPLIQTQSETVETTSITTTSTANPRPFIMTDSNPNNLTSTRNVIIADSSVGEALKIPSTALIVPGSYIVPVSMVKGAQQIVQISGGNKILTTVPTRPGQNMLVFQGFLNQNRKVNLQTVKYSTIQPLTSIATPNVGNVASQQQQQVVLPPNMVALGQPLSLKKIENGGNKSGNEIFLTISQPREQAILNKVVDKTSTDTPQPDSSSNVSSEPVEIKIEDISQQDTNSRVKVIADFPKTTAVATSVIASCIKEEMIDHNTPVDIITDDDIKMEESDQGIKAQEPRKPGERIKSVLVNASSSNGPMLSHTNSRYRKRSESAETISSSSHNGEKVSNNEPKIFNTKSYFRSKKHVLSAVNKKLESEMQKQAALERELRLQKSLSEECEDLGVDEPSTSDLFPEADLLFDANHSPAYEHTEMKKSSHSTVSKTDKGSNMIFSDDENSGPLQADALFDYVQYPVGQTIDYPSSAQLLNGNNESVSSCDDNTLLSNSGTMQEVTLNSPISAEIYTDSQPTNKYKYKYSNRKKNEKTSSKSESPSDKTWLSNEPSETPTDSVSSRVGVPSKTPPETETECKVHCKGDEDSKRGARRSLKKPCACCNGSKSSTTTTVAPPKKRPLTPSRSPKRVMPNKKR